MGQMSHYFPDWKKQNTDKNFLMWLYTDKFFYQKHSEAMKNYNAWGVSEIFKTYRNQTKIIVYLDKALPGWKKINASEGFERWLKENDAFWSKQRLFSRGIQRKLNTFLENTVKKRGCLSCMFPKTVAATKIA